VFSYSKNIDIFIVLATSRPGMISFTGIAHLLQLDHLLFFPLRPGYIPLNRVFSPEVTDRNKNSQKNQSYVHDSPQNEIVFGKLHNSLFTGK
jgi:hypothetical protein